MAAEHQQGRLLGLVQVVAEGGMADRLALLVLIQPAMGRAVGEHHQGAVQGVHLKLQLAGFVFPGEAPGAELGGVALEHTHPALEGFRNGLELPVAEPFDLMVAQGEGGHGSLALKAAPVGAPPLALAVQPVAQATDHVEVRQDVAREHDPVRSMGGDQGLGLPRMAAVEVGEQENLHGIRMGPIRGQRVSTLPD